MNIGPDGSLPRITSSFKGFISNLKIAKVPDDQIDESGLAYKLIWTNNEDENQISEESDEEEWSEEEIPVIPIREEKNKIVDSVDFSSDKPIEGNRPKNVEFPRHNNKNRHRYNRKKNRNRVRRNLNAPGAYNGSNSMIPRNEERNNFHSNQRDFVPLNDYRNCNLPLQSNRDIEPWAQNFPFGSYGFNSNSYGPVINQPVMTPPNSVVENSIIQNNIPMGLLPIPQGNFSNPSNNRNSKFEVSQNYYDNNRNNFPRHRQNEFPRQRQWPYKNNRHHGNWNRRQAHYRPQENNKRNKNHFDYRK